MITRGCQGIEKAVAGTISRYVYDTSDRPSL